ncbi:complement C1s subcomponent [Hypomesus transpacificus]|uniref:complement C1s subcomponent n=1 Tax=Hypomesus transpacificus TaxID=137520 RepID=UPI001F079DDA|nr:complement C1s subcomponent [Hypomesus transpacificus]
MCSDRFDRHRMTTMQRLSLCLILLPHYAFSVLLGWVESPGYPRGYPPFASTNWSRCAPPGHIISLRLIHLNLEDSSDCDHDALEIFADGNRLEKLCGIMSPDELDASVNPLLSSTTGGCLSLSFRSDYSNTKRHTGFRGFYTLQDFDECYDDPDNGCTQFCHNHIGGYRCSCRPGYYLDTDEHTCTVSCSEDLSGALRGVISTPSRPGPYAENAQCSYTLSVEEHLQLVLEFMGEFDVEQGPEGQCVDTLTIKTPSKVVGTYCGHVAPPPVHTGSHHAHILFSSDGYGTNTGFTIHYSTKAKTCPGFVTSGATMTPELPEYEHGNKVTVHCELGKILNSDARKKTHSDVWYESICQRTGKWSPAYHCESVDCGEPDIPKDDILQVTESDPSTLYGDKVQFRCKSKYYTLEGEDEYTCNVSGHWISETGQGKFPKCIEVCGKTENELESTGRIWGGDVAKLRDIPWQLLMLHPTRAGATLINDRWAITAAHVVEKNEELTKTIYGGVIDGQKARQSHPEVAVLQVKKVIIHPGYAKSLDNSVRTNFDNDIALIQLTERVTLGPAILPICLPEPDEELEADTLGTVSGWGATEKREQSRMLRHTDVAVYTTSKCEDTPRIEENPLVFTGNMFCAGKDGHDSCRGDSGGPFVVPRLGNQNKPHRLMGVVSWGSKCEEHGDFKGYYTKVSKYLGWIKETIEKEESDEE